MNNTMDKNKHDNGTVTSITSLHLPQYNEIYTKVKNRLGRLLRTRKTKHQGYRVLALEIIDTAHNIIVDKLKAYRHFYIILKQNVQLFNYVKDVYGSQGLQLIRQAAYLDSQVTRLWRTLRKHLQYMPLDGIVNESLNYAARLLSIVRRKRRILERVLEIKKDVSKTPLVKSGVMPVLLVGVPNAGKSTLAGKLGNVDFEVGAYPFTTKRAKAVKKTIDAQIEILMIDTPGILDLSKPNLIERRALAFIKYPKSIIVFLIDPSYESTASLEEQLQLLERIIELNPNVIVAINKIDSVTEEVSIDDLIKRIKALYPELEIIAISAIKGVNLDMLINSIKKIVLRKVMEKHSAS